MPDNLRILIATLEDIHHSLQLVQNRCETIKTIIQDVNEQ
jgi:hypothetical protein